MQRPATPGAMKLPAGAKDRERFDALEARVKALELRLETLVNELTHKVEALEVKATGDRFASMDREALKAHLTEMGVDFARNASDEKLRDLCRE